MKKIIILLAFIISACVGPPELFYHCIPDSKTINFEDKRNEYFEGSIYENLQMYPIKDSLLLYSQVSNLATGKVNNVKGLFFFVNNYEQTEISFDFLKSLISSKNHNYDISITNAPPAGKVLLPPKDTIEPFIFQDQIIINRAKFSKQISETNIDTLVFTTWINGYKHEVHYLLDYMNVDKCSEFN